MVLLCALGILIAAGRAMAEESAGFQMTQDGMYFYWERPSGMLDEEARHFAIQAARSEGWEFQGVALDDADGQRYLRMKLQQGFLDAGRPTKTWRFTPSRWTKSGNLTLEILILQPAEVHIQPALAREPATPPEETEGFTYAMYKPQRPVEITVMFPPAIARHHAWRLGGLLALPIVLGALTALILRRRAAARWAIFQKLTLLLTGVLFIIYYHITSDRGQLLWLTCYLGKLVSPFLFLAMLASFVLMKWTAALLGDLRKEFRVTPAGYLFSIVRSYGILTLPMAIYIGVSLFIENEMAALFTALGIAVLSSIFAPLLFRALVRGRIMSDPTLSALVREVAGRVKVAPPRSYIYGAGGGQGANAFVAGWLAPFRSLFINDVLVATFRPEELQAVVAHEFGHWKRRHALWFSLYILAVMGAAGALWEVAPSGWSDALLIAAMAAGTLGFFFLSRMFERQADAVAYHLFGEVYLTALLKVQASSGALHVRTLEFLQSHPSIPDRIAYLTRNAQKEESAPS